MKKYKIQINYKSGNSITLWFKKFEIFRRGSEIVSAEWELVDDNPQFIYFGLDNIESIIQLEVKDE